MLWKWWKTMEAKIFQLTFLTFLPPIRILPRTEKHRHRRRVTLLTSVISKGLNPILSCKPLKRVMMCLWGFKSSNNKQNTEKREDQKKSEETATEHFQTCLYVCMCVWCKKLPATGNPVSVLESPTSRNLLHLHTTPPLLIGQQAYVLTGCYGRVII